MHSRTIIPPQAATTTNTVYIDDDLWYRRQKIYVVSPLHVQRFTSVWKFRFAGNRGYRAKCPPHPSYAP